MDKYEEAVREYMATQQRAIDGAVRMGILQAIDFITVRYLLDHAFRWYDEQREKNDPKPNPNVVAPAFDVVTHGELTKESTTGKAERGKETCETCALRARIGCPFNAHPDALEFVLKVGPGRFGCTYYRRIVEKEGK